MKDQCVLIYSIHILFLIYLFILLKNFHESISTSPRRHRSSDGTRTVRAQVDPKPVTSPCRQVQNKGRTSESRGKEWGHKHDSRSREYLGSIPGTLRLGDLYVPHLTRWTSYRASESVMKRALHGTGGWQHA
jgi:hypothetical protein